MAQTPRKWLDVHGHFYPAASPEVRKQKHQAMLDGLFLVPESATLWNPSSVITYLDTAGVQMQLVSNIPKTLPELHSSNDYGASIVRQYPTRFGFLAALPTDDVSAALSEINRAASELHADGFAVTCCYNDIYLSDSSLEPMWEELNKRHATVFTHPNAYAAASMGRPSPLIEVAFETARTVVDMLYTGIFRRYPHITFIISHTGGALPALSGRLKLLGSEPWVPNPLKITKEEIRQTLGRLFVDTAATGMAETLEPACRMVGKEGIVYGSDCGVPCSTVETMEENRRALLESGVLSGEEVENMGRRAWKLFPRAAERVRTGGEGA